MLQTNKVYLGDNINLMKKLPDNCIDAIVTDPPYGLGFMFKTFDCFGTPKEFQKWTNNWATECLRILKPGGFLLSFGGTRTQHRMVSGIEDAGFEIRDTILWVYATGFPKSLNVGKQIDKLQGNERETVEVKRHAPKFNTKLKAGIKNTGYNKRIGEDGRPETFEVTIGNSIGEGWGTALKPAVEMVTVARKPLSEKTVALNFLKWGTGGLNINGTRIKYKNDGDKKSAKWGNQTGSTNIYGIGIGNMGLKNVLANEQGRFPSNLILDEESAKLLDQQSGKLHGHGSKKHSTGAIKGMFKQSGNKKELTQKGGESGGASRFFYVAKASKTERNLGCEKLEVGERVRQGLAGEHKNTFSQNTHVCVKPIKLLEYLVKLVSRKGSIILDPFIGSGSTAIACFKTGRKFIGMEKDENYVKIANARISYYMNNSLNKWVKGG